MECQSRLEPESNRRRVKPETSLEWIEADPIDNASAFEIQPVTPCSCSATEPDSESIPIAPPSTATLTERLTETLLASRTIQEALAQLTARVGEALQAESCIVVLQGDASTVSQVAEWCADATLAVPTEALFKILNHATVQAGLMLNEPLAISDWATFAPVQKLRHSRATPKIVPLSSAPQIRAVLAVKTQFQGQRNGMIVLTRSQPYEWKESDVQLLKSLSPYVSIAASQFQLEQQVQQQIRYQTLINELTTAIRNAWELDRIFQFAIEGTASALQVTRGMLLLLKYADPLHRSCPAQQIPQARVNVTAEWWEETLTRSLHPQSTPDQRSFWASGCSLCQRILTGNSEPIVLPACDASLETVPLETVPLESAPLESIRQRHWQEAIAPIFHLDTLPALLLVPLENQGTVLGSLVFQHSQRLWSLEDITLVKLVAAQISTAIIQSRALQQIQSVVQERTAQLQRSLDVQAKLYEKTRQQVEQLRRLNQEREEFLSTISHELRTPLTSMTLAIRMLRQADLSPERRDRYLDILEQQCVQETQLINDLLALRKLEANSAEAQLQKLDLRYLIQDVVQSAEAHLAEKNLTLELDLPTKPLIVYTEADSFSRILTELLTNAQKYSVADSKIQLQVVHELSSAISQVVLLLKNTGAGILPDELPYIFDKFRRCQGVTKQAIQGTGLGLALVKGLVEHLGGTIAATSQPLDQRTDWQTCFTVTLPQSPEGCM
jgi:signal transduction histidine kinase